MINAINLTLDICGFVILLLLIYAANFEYKPRGPRGNMFLAIIYCIFIYTFLDIVSWTYALDSSAIQERGYTLMLVINALEYILAQLWFVLYSSYIVTFLSEQQIKSKFLRIIQLTVLALGFCGAVSVLVTGDIEMSLAGYGFEPHAFYSYYMYINIVFYLLFVSFMFYHRKVVNSTHDILVLVTYMALPFVSGSLDFFTDCGLYTYPFIAALSNLICLVMMQQHAIDRGIRALEEERLLATQLQVKIMLSQIKPHFLYNSLNVIVGLCDIDAQEAKRATINFAKFLRGHLKALGNQELISFRNELEHVDAYINIEKARFGDDFRVEYNLNSENFKLPSLTLQPLVENAIRHGIRPLGKGRILISTSETEDYWLVSVEDNGIGFDVRRILDDNEHVGIANIRKRLKLQCGGELEISSVPNKGSKTVIYIPKDRQ